MILDLIKTGWDHILDLEGIDHMLFVATLCSIYLVRDWKKILILVTAFTIGHSLTLALSAYRVVKVDAGLVETLIPVTIIVTAIFNMVNSWVWDYKEQKNDVALYVMALLFGLIHGLGFSNFFKEMYGPEESIVAPLLYFNIGVELGQILVVAIIMAVSYIIVNILKIERKYWTLAVAGVSIVKSVMILIA